MRAICIVTTVGNEDQANLIASELVARRHAACVNILPKVRSVFRWQGQICQEDEYMLLIKSREEDFEDVAETILELHSYELPEILAFNVSQGDDDFLRWIAASVDKDADFDDDEAEDGEPAPG